MAHPENIIIKDLYQNNVKHISFSIPKEKIVVFTGVSGSGKSSIVFDTIAAESQRQMNETYTSFIRGRLPKYEKPKVESIEHLSPSIIIDQTRLGGNARSTVGTISDMYTTLRLLYARIATPYVGTASYFSFNNPNGMCPACFGIGKVMELDILPMIDPQKSWMEGMVDLPAFHINTWYWKQYTSSGLFDLHKPFCDYTEKERNLLLYGAEHKGGKRQVKQVEGIHTMMSRLLIKHDSTEIKDASLKRLTHLIHITTCPQCQGKRLHEKALSAKVMGYRIDEMCEMEFRELIEIIQTIDDPRAVSLKESLITSLQRMIDIGLPYLSMDRESATLSGGEAQRLKLVRYMGSSLTGMIYIFDEPSMGMHPYDVHRLTKLLQKLRDKGNTVLVVEHDKDVIAIADHIIDIGPQAGIHGGEVLFQGSYDKLLASSTKTGKALRSIQPIKTNCRIPKDYLPIRDASLHNLKHISIDIPLQLLCVVTGVAGSGKSTLMKEVFAKQYKERVVLVDQSAITASSRSTLATFLGFFDDIRVQFASQHHVSPSLFSFNSKGACPICKGKGEIVTELVFMDPVTTICEACNGSRYQDSVLTYRYREKHIVEILDMSVEEAYTFFSDCPKIKQPLASLIRVGLSYLSLGQPLSTLSGGERQRIKLAKDLDKKGSIYIIDEPTTGLHASDIQTILHLFHTIVEQGNSVIIIEHHLDVIKQADYIIDIGPEGGTQGGEVVFQGTPQQMLENSTSITADYLRKSLR